MVFDLIVVGGGAAGFYGAIHAAEADPGRKILILEKSVKLLSKVKVSGGGRCNVTHNCFGPAQLAGHYPRGKKLLRSVFKEYGPAESVAWFAKNGVSLKTEEDGRMFPVTDDSQTVISCFLTRARDLSIKVNTGEGVVDVRPGADEFEVFTSKGSKLVCKKLLIAIGGSPKREAYGFLSRLGHRIIPPIPSLFTFNDKYRAFSDLMGISVPDAEVRITSTKFRQKGPLLITHWGLSGPAVIKLSAWAAEYLHAVNYEFQVQVSWIGAANENEVRDFLVSQKRDGGRQRVANTPLWGLPKRLWELLCTLSEIPGERTWSDASNRQLNKLLEHVIRCSFQIKGKTTFREEFVTCGGIDLSEVDLATMESKKVKGLFFAGEVLNIDGETGGFNFQAAWSSGFLAGRAIAAK